MSTAWEGICYICIPSGRRPYVCKIMSIFTIQKLQKKEELRNHFGQLYNHNGDFIMEQVKKL